MTTHCGAWEDWDEARKHVVGKPIYMDMSYSLGYLSREAMRTILLDHPSEFLLFGTDSPWEDQAEALQALRDLDLGSSREQAMLVDNARRLLDRR